MAKPPRKFRYTPKKSLSAGHKPAITHPGSGGKMVKIKGDWRREFPFHGHNVLPDSLVLESQLEERDELTKQKKIERLHFSLKSGISPEEREAAETKLQKHNGLLDSANGMEQERVKYWDKPEIRDRVFELNEIQRQLKKSGKGELSPARRKFLLGEAERLNARIESEVAKTPLNELRDSHNKAVEQAQDIEQELLKKHYTRFKFDD
jgi:hypothetical protein